MIEQNGIANENQIDASSVITDGSEGLRVLARLIARRLQREALAKAQEPPHTIDLGAASAGQEGRSDD